MHVKEFRRLRPGLREIEFEGKPWSRQQEVKSLLVVDRVVKQPFHTLLVSAFHFAVIRLKST